jgi:hypothetical protein
MAIGDTHIHVLAVLYIGFTIMIADVFLRYLMRGREGISGFHSFPPFR